MEKMIQIRHLSKEYRLQSQTMPALHNVNLDLPLKRLTVLVGPSGCGKTTLLRILANLEKPTEGQVILPFQPNNASLKIGFVFQEPRLFPWLTVRENILLGREEFHSEEDLTLILNSLELTSFRDAFPRQLSGGMAQRASLGRTLYQDPDVILMDEPFASLDYFTRVQLQDELLQLFLKNSKTILFVTHDVEEAVYLAQNLIVMSQGEILFSHSIPGDSPRQRYGNETEELKQELLQSLTIAKKGDALCFKQN